VTDDELRAMTPEEFAKLMNGGVPPPGYENSPGWVWCLFMRMSHLRGGLPREALDEASQ
jgi:hypothetical protein